MAAQRVRRKQAGLQRFEFWLHPNDETRIRRYVERLAKRREVK